LFLCRVFCIVFLSPVSSERVQSKVMGIAKSSAGVRLLWGMKAGLSKGIKKKNKIREEEGWPIR